MRRRRAVSALLDERYAPPTWWASPPPQAAAVLNDGWVRCAGCGHDALLDHPCPHCLAERAATRKQVSVG